MRSRAISPTSVSLLTVITGSTSWRVRCLSGPAATQESCSPSARISNHYSRRASQAAVVRTNQIAFAYHPHRHSVPRLRCSGCLRDVSVMLPARHAGNLTWINVTRPSVGHSESWQTRGVANDVCSVSSIFDGDMYCYRSADAADFTIESASARTIEPSSPPQRKSLGWESYPMIKTILVPATGSDADAGVFATALAVARPFGAHLGFLHVRIDAAAFAATMMPELGTAQAVTDLLNKMEEEAEQREQEAKQLFERFYRHEGLPLAETLSGSPAPTAEWVRAIGSEPYWVTEYGRAVDLLVIGRPSDPQRALSDTLEAALINSGRPLFIPPSAPNAALPETVVIAWKATSEAARAVTAAMPFLSIAKQIVIMTVAEDESLLEEEGAARLMAISAGMDFR